MIRISRRPFPYRFLSSLFLLYLIASCVTAQDIKKTKPISLIENVPFYPQEAYQCGPASLAGALNYWGISVTPEEIAEEIFSKSAKGTLNIDMVFYAQRKGLDAIQYKGSLEDLRKNIDSGIPVIVLVDYGFSLYQANHFMVAVGYNENGVIVNSGKEKEKFIAQDDFMKTWEKTKYWTILIKCRKVRESNETEGIE
jgi:predicted double-glycine peptidase